MVSGSVHIPQLFGALAGLALAGCVQANGIGFAHFDAREASAPATDGPAADSTADLPALPDTGDTATPPPDVPLTECTPRALGCTADGKATRICSEQGRWTAGAACPAQTTCSAGVCLCPGNCAEDPVAETQTVGVVQDLVGGGRYLYLAVNGPQGSIRRFDLNTRMETTVKSVGTGVASFALDSDVMGNLLWCSDTMIGGTRSGELVDGSQPLDTGFCTHVRRRDDLVYFNSDVLYRKARNLAATRQTVTREPVDSFEIAGEFLYFVGEAPAGAGTEAVLSRVRLADATAVETITRRPDTSFFRLMPDASHVYLISQGHILRAAQAPDVQAETFWQEAEPEAWAMTQTDTHVYWSSTSGASASMDCGEAQVLRRAKAGGPVTTLARTPGYCAGQLVIIDDRVYAAVWKGTPGAGSTRILRIRP
jgi:hypothetical protein